MHSGVITGRQKEQKTDGTMMGLFANLCCQKTGKSDVAISSHSNRFSSEDTCKNLSNDDDYEFSADDGTQQNRGDDGSHLNLKLGTHDETSVEESSEKMNHDSVLTEKKFPTEQVASDDTKTGEQSKISVDEHRDMTLEPKTNPTQLDHHINGKESFSTGISSTFCETSVEHAMALENVFVHEQFNPCDSDNTMDVMKNDQAYTTPPVKSSSSLDEMLAAKDKIRTPSVEQAIAMMNQGTLQEQDNDEKKELHLCDATVDAKETLKMRQDNIASNTTVIDVDEVTPESDKKLPAKANPDASPTPLSTAKDMKDLSLEDTHVVANMQTDYPLDGKWEMIWKLHPENATTFELRNHTFDMMGCPCELIWTENSGGISRASFQWPSLVSEYPVYQETKKEIPTGATCIEWTTSDSKYGDAIWNRLDSKGCEIQPEEKEQSPKVLEAPAYPLDGNWVLTWKSYYLEPSLVIVHNHQLELFDCRCEIKLNAEEDYRPSVQWPAAIFSEETPIFQKGKKSIPKDLKVSESPKTIEWTITDKQYGEVTWTRLDSGDSVASHINDKKRKELDKDETKNRSEEEEKRMKSSIPGKAWDLKRKSTDDDAIQIRRKEEEKRMKSSTAGKAWDLVKGLIKLSEQLEEVEMIAHDDIIYLAERLLGAQRDFKERNCPSRVDIAYHHTESWNLETIKTNGLLSRSEREQRSIYSRFNGSACGDGIYCSGDPVAYANRRFGDTTILLARMKGIESTGRNISNEFNTSMHSDFCVLKCCNQCIPLFMFKSKLLGRPRSRVQPNAQAFREKLAVFQQSVQELLDSIINETVNGPANVAWLERHNSLNSFADPQAFSNFLQIPMPRIPKMVQFPRPSPATAFDAKLSTLKDIQDCNSTVKLIDFIRNNNSAPLSVQAAKKRLMTISPEAYSKFSLSKSWPPSQQKLQGPLPKGLLFPMRKPGTLDQQKRLAQQNHLMQQKLQHLPQYTNTHKRQTKFSKKNLNSHQAASLGQLDVLKEIASTQSRSELWKADHNAWRPIHEAARGGHADVLEYLLKNGAMVNERTNFNRGGNALFWAMKEPQKHAKAIAVLKKYGGVVIPPLFMNEDEAMVHSFLHPKCRPQKKGNVPILPASFAASSAHRPDQNVNKPTPASNSSLVHQNQLLVQQNQLLVQQNIESICANHPSWAYPTPFAPGQSGQTLTNERTLSSSAAVGLAKTDDQKFRKPNLTYMQLCGLNCSLCRDALVKKGEIIQLNNCDHYFHKDCILKSIQTNSCCPVCSVPIGNTPG